MMYPRKIKRVHLSIPPQPDYLLSSEVDLTHLVGVSQPVRNQLPAESDYILQMVITNGNVASLDCDPFVHRPRYVVTMKEDVRNLLTQLDELLECG